jgi:hypothetical protein
MLFVVMTPMEGTSWKHLAMVLACVHLIPDGTTNLPPTFLPPSRYGASNHSRVLFKTRPLRVVESHRYGDAPKLQW